MRKNYNTERIEGRIYEHNLVIKTVQNKNSDNFGKEFISGTIDIATDEEGLNVLQVHFTYVSPTTKAGGTNNTYNALKKIINEGQSWITSGKDNATKVRIDSALALNDFYAQDDTLVSVKRNEGSFVTFINDLSKDLNERNKFTTDMVITNVTMIEADEEKHIDKAYLSVRGAVFNFRNDILPVEFVVRDPDGMKYFENLDVSPANPVYTKVWGKIVSTTTEIPSVEESAFGESVVHITSRKSKEWIITGAAKIPYEFGEENVLTVDELTKAMQNREIRLAEIKKSSDEYKAARAANVDSAFSAGNVMNIPGMQTPTGGWNF